MTLAPFFRVIEWERVALDLVVRCGTCHFCRTGSSNLCANRFGKGVKPLGGFGEYVVVTATQAFRFPASLSFAECIEELRRVAPCSAKGFGYTASRIDHLADGSHAVDELLCRQPAAQVVEREHPHRGEAEERHRRQPRAAHVAVYQRFSRWLTPLFQSNADALARLAGDAAVLVDPESVDSIAEGIGNLLDDATLRNSLRMRGRTRAASMTWEATARNTLEVLEAL